MFCPTLRKDVKPQPPTLNVLLARTDVLRNHLQLLGVKVNALGQQREEWACLIGNAVATDLLPVQKVVQQLRRLRCDVRRVPRGALFGVSVTVLGRNKVHGLVFGHVAMDWEGNGNVSGN